ncbi:latexin [Hypomesus transpacificus]|uniref:latexin n=1 Tax=Hypomesus transpacificus TaxID=137520 RepID=UPI001F079D7F|nr:latexin [Hypomesus transpacificus]
MMRSPYFPARSVLFRKEENGVTYRVPALLYIPSSSSFLVFCEERLSPSDSQAHLLVMRKGTFYRNYVEWEDMRVLGSARLEGHRSMNPCPVYDEFTGTLFLFFIAVLGHTSEAHQLITGKNLTRLCCISSSDHGDTWSPTIDLTVRVIGDTITEGTMTGRMLVVLTALLTAGTGAEPLSSSSPELLSEVAIAQLLEETDIVMATGDLNPSHYPAQRAAKVVQHYLNTRYGTPHRVIMLERVHKASAEEVAELGRKYHLELSVQETITNRTESVSAEVVFPGGETKAAPQVQATCDGLLQINTQALDEAFYHKHRASNILVSAENIPDSYGYVDPSMEALWNLGKVVSSEVMLRESNESTLYNLAQVASITQLETENTQLRFQYQVLLHEMVSQEIVTWKLLVSWSPAEGVRVLETEWIPKCEHCVAPPNHYK